MFIKSGCDTAFVFGKSINDKGNSKVDENFVKNVINAENIVKLHYESNISNEELGNLLEKGWDYAESYIINNNIENSTAKNKFNTKIKKNVIQKYKINGIQK
ncbi:hypothetical protein U3516DRAFT_742285 [Neocallimastix sp. 'constans']